MKIKLFKWNEEAMDYQLVDDELKVGDGVTLNYYSDEEPATIIEIDPKGQWIKVQEDNAKRIDNNGMSDCQDYEITRNENGRIHIFKKTRRKNGPTFFTDTGRSTYDDYGIHLSLKVRRKYYDYSF